MLNNTKTIETLGEAILNLSGQTDLPITLIICLITPPRMLVFPRTYLI